MAKYGSCLTFDDFSREVQGNKHSEKATEKIDYLLLEGGKVKSHVHKKIKEDSNIKGYGSPGKLFSGNGENRDPQQRTLWGHIAHLIVDEGCAFKFGKMVLDGSISNEMMDDIIGGYEDDEFIQIVGFRSEVKGQTESSSSEASSKVFVPTETYIEELVRKIDPDRKGVTEENLWASIENDFSNKGKALKADWKSRVRKIINKQ